MDKLDVRILGILLGGDPASPNFRPPFRGVARKLRVDENTVRNRLKRLRETGFLKGWLVAVNPSLLGQRVALVWLDVDRTSRKPEVLQKIALVDGASLVLDYFGSAIGVHLYYTDERELERRVDLISKIALSSTVERREITFPESRILVSRTDWRIIRSLQRDPWRPYVSVAADVGVSSATVKRRLARLNRSKALFLLAEIDPRAIEGSLLAHLFVFYENTAERNRIDHAIARQVGDELAFAELDEPDVGFYALHLTNLSRVRSLREWLDRLHGVRRAKLELLEDMVPSALVQESIIRQGLGEPRGRGSKMPTQGYLGH